MILPNNFNTSIHEILEYANKDTFFISDWNKESDILNFEISNINLPEQYHTQKNIYFFSDEFQNIKENYAPFVLCGKKFKPISPEHFSIVSNCTIAGFLTLYCISKQKNEFSALILAPTYFSHIRILQDIGASIYYLNCYNNENIVNEIYEIINHNKIDVIIATEPLFGTGVSLSENAFYEINEICNKYKIYFLIDYTYGGMKWDDYIGAQETFFINLTNNKYTILIESVCKRIFLNGIKHGIIIADTQIIKEIEEISVYTAGCLSEQQILVYKHLYSSTTQNYITETINNNNKHYASNYVLVKILLANFPFEISLCDCGYFCLIGILKNSQMSNMSIAKNILLSTNILTIPHDRYIFNNNKYYYFRINLAVSQDKLISAMQTLLKTYSDGVY